MKNGRKKKSVFKIKTVLMLRWSQNTVDQTHVVTGGDTCRQHHRKVTSLNITTGEIPLKAQLA